MKRILSTSMLFAFLVLFSFASSFSQNVPADSITSMLIKDWERAKAYTQEYMNAMPADKYSFRATDSVRSFAQQLLHLAQANMFFLATATGEKPTYAGPDLEKSSSAQAADSVKYYVNASYDFAINSIKKLPPAAVFQNATLTMRQTITVMRLVWILKAFEHQTHHRGQTTIYLRLAGVRPPAERLF
jgi:uncharacterized damage-inducible protein DinB